MGIIKILTVQDGGTGNYQRIMLFLNAKPLKDYFEGTAGDQNFEVIEQMVKNIVLFSSQGSGWFIIRFEKLQISFAAFSQ